MFLDEVSDHPGFPLSTCPVQCIAGIAVQVVLGRAEPPTEMFDNSEVSSTGRQVESIECILGSEKTVENQYTRLQCTVTM